MDKDVKRISPDMQPSDDGGLVEMESVNQRNDKPAIAIFGISMIVVLAFVMWGVVLVADPVQVWIGKKLNPEPTATPIPGFYCDTCPERACPEQAPLECPVLVCPGCDPCLTVPDDQITNNREAIDKYLVRADDYLSDMEAAIALMGEVGVIMRDFGQTSSARMNAFDNKQWKNLVEDTRDKVDSILDKLFRLWPPGPYNSCNPLLDAHARLLLAFVNLDKARDIMMRGFHARNPDMLYFYAPHAGYARENMALARAQLAKVR